MAGAHSPSNAFAHLQHHQHNGLLGPSMQVRDPHISLMQPSASFASALWSPAPQPFPYITTLSSLQTVQFSDSAWMSCSFNHFDMTCVVLTVIYYGYSEPCVTVCKQGYAMFGACCLWPMPVFYTLRCLIDV